MSESDPTSAPTNPDGAPWRERTAPWPLRSAPLYGPEFTRDPLAYYETLRRDFGPIAPVTLDEKGTFRGYLVLDHVYQLEVLRNHGQVWARDSRWYRDLVEGTLPLDHPLVPQIAYRRHRLYADGAEHTRMAAAGNQALGELDLVRVRDLIEALAHQLIDAFLPGPEDQPEDGAESEAPAAPAEELKVDILADYALPLPLLVMMRLAGMNEDSALATGTAIHELLSGGPEAARAAAELSELMAALVAEKRDRPGPDLVSWILHHNRDSGLDEHELREEVWLQIVVGRGASTTWTCNTLLELLSNDDLYSDVLANRCSMDEAMNHVMWVNAPVQNLFGYWATQPTKLGPYRLDQGDMAIVSLGSSGMTMRAAGLDVSRTNNAHLAWGAGEHGCPARDLGRLIVRTGLEVLWDRLPGIELAVPKEELTWDLPYMARTPTALPVTFPRPSAEPKDAARWTRDTTPFTSSPPRPTSTEEKERPSERPGRLPLWRSLVAWWPRR
ncbi:cytochrome P450 family protein [Streptomyces millisiae]|uniref:Cytochrome P450 n=1 Tax=Streptomyces millisiae TaxID=3075542 RepID=A0ABU2LQQ5_9ACTN|nr:cytochrome P450 [Streptomyces sp. DSM 44918]MDT0319557.1 cytochrome P450 [Streptomyces sp. DSM 44918]